MLAPFIASMLAFLVSLENFSNVLEQEFLVPFCAFFPSPLSNTSTVSFYAATLPFFEYLLVLRVI